MASYCDRVNGLGSSRVRGSGKAVVAESGMYGHLRDESLRRSALGDELVPGS